MWILPTRNRPDLCKRAVESFMDNGFRGPCFVSMDGCDYDMAFPDGFTPIVWRSHVGISHQVNWLFNYLPNERNYGILCDDMVAETPFQEELEEAAGDWLIANAEDMMLHGKKKDGTPWLSTAPCHGGDLVRTVGFLAIPGTFHQGHDWLYAPLGHRLGLLRYLDVVVRHIHWRNGTRERDGTDGVRPPYDMKVIGSWLEENFDDICERVVAACGDLPERKVRGAGEREHPALPPDALRSPRPA